MMKLEALIHPFKLDAVKAALEPLHCGPLIISQIAVNGAADAKPTHYRGCEYRPDVHRVKIELIVSANCLDDVVDTISTAASRAGDANDGTILVYQLSDV